MVDSGANPKPVCWQAYLQLLRLPNVFTAVADVSMGYLLVSAGRVEVPLFLPLLVCSAAMYLAGMVLNDVCDYQQDLGERPWRPLPAGQIAQSVRDHSGHTIAAHRLGRWMGHFLDRLPRSHGRRRDAVGRNGAGV